MGVHVRVHVRQCERWDLQRGDISLAPNFSRRNKPRTKSAPLSQPPPVPQHNTSIVPSPIEPRVVTTGTPVPQSQMRQVASFASLLYKPAALYIDVVRDSYEAFVLYQFMSLLVEYCGGERELVRVLNCKQKHAAHLWPLCCCTFAVDKDFLMRCKRGTLQYCIVKPCTTALGLILHQFGVYHDGHLDFTNDAFPYFFILNNTSIRCQISRTSLAPRRRAGLVRDPLRIRSSMYRM